MGEGEFFPKQNDREECQKYLAIPQRKKCRLLVPLMPNSQGPFSESHAPYNAYHERFLKIAILNYMILPIFPQMEFNKNVKSPSSYTY